MLISINTVSFSQGVNQLIAEGDALQDAMNENAALGKYLTAAQADPYNIYALCQSSFLYGRIAGRLKNNKTEQDRNFDLAKAYAESALKVNPYNPEANVAMAIAMGRVALKKGGKEKINAVKDIKKYADLALKYDPNNYKAWHVIAKWNYEISSLNFFERTAVKVFFGDLPTATIDDAVAGYKKSMSLNPSFLLNYLSIAKAYDKKDDPDTAKRYLNTLLNMPIKMTDDFTIKKEARDLLAKL